MAVDLPDRTSVAVSAQGGGAAEVVSRADEVGEDTNRSSPCVRTPVPALQLESLMRASNSIAAAVVFGAFACSSPTYLEDLQTPALVWTRSAGLCSKVVAVDGPGAIWTHQGCEDGRPDLRKVRTVSPPQLSDLWAKFEVLPFDQGGTREMCAGRLLHAFARWEPQSRRGASACGGSAYEDVSALPEPFRSLAELLRKLE
jgi:hypothetical protein